LATTRSVLAVRQVPEVLLRLHGAIGLQQVLLPAAPFGLFGKLAVGAQPDRAATCCQARFRQEGQIELPELLESLVEKAQLLVRIEDRDGRIQLIKCIGVAADRTLMLLADRLDIADIAGQP
jgi:hypothetical protein